jgi:hypothetical protein
VILFRNYSSRQRLQIESFQHLFSLLAIHWSLRPDLNPRSSFPPSSNPQWQVKIKLLR